MSLAAGAKLAHYEIVSSIGRGGMGEVYRARDTKLGRDVAIKVLPEELAGDPERVARFEREAKLLASLNHPNIASIYGFEDGDDVKALALELVEGPTLAERIAEGPLPVEEVVTLADQVAKALVAGHEAGVIHRDLKPANIKLKEDGTVKVLDYGLAKAIEGERSRRSDSELSQSPTITRQGTEMGVILGTAPYMSPEQAKGKPVDRRTDVWAFGAVVYEMLTGHRAFPGQDVSETLAWVLAKEPAWEDLPRETPPALRQVLRLCLTKDANLRVRDMADVRLAISGAFGTSPVDQVDAHATPRARALPAAGVAAIAGAVIAALTLTWGDRTATAPAGPTTRSSVMVPETRAIPDRMCFPCRILAISPDGMEIAYTGVNPDLPPGERDAQFQLQLRSLTTLDVRDLPGTSGATQPFFSPDGKWIAFFTGTGELAKISLAGGNPITLVEELEGSRWGSGVWMQDGTIVFATSPTSISALASV
ncbi:MAG TPA: protein kinase, partial [Vicinamibacteria bacterium]|nr:protein kinase [Vicinamibacteria bacterium]